MENKETKRQAIMKDTILGKLRKAGTVGITNAELSKVSVRYGGYLGELYKRGYVINTKNIGDGLFSYTLVSEPDEEITNHKSALDMLVEGIDKIGSVDGKELRWLLDELGLNVKRKANTYKKGALV